MPATTDYRAEHQRRSWRLGLAKGDLHDADVIAADGPHERVWCSGVLCHSPNPLLVLERLRTITRGC